MRICPSEFHSLMFMDNSLNVDFAFLYIAIASVRVFASVTRLSTYRLFFIRSFNSFFVCCKWCFIVAPNKNGLEIIPNGILQKQYVNIFIGSISPFLLLIHKNLVTSRSSFCKPTCRKAFYISEIMSYLYNLNFSNNATRSSSINGSLYKLI